MVNWYYNYLIHRNITITSGGITITVSIGNGFPQGGVNSADFSKIAFNEALEIVNENEIRGKGFADDLLLLKGGYNMDAAMKSFQK